MPLAGNFTRFFCEFSSEFTHDSDKAAVSTRAPALRLTAVLLDEALQGPLPLTQRFMTQEQYEAALKALRLPNAAAVPRFLLPTAQAKASCQRERTVPTTSAWSMFFEAFATESFATIQKHPHKQPPPQPGYYARPPPVTFASSRRARRTGLSAASSTSARVWTASASTSAWSKP